MAESELNTNMNAILKIQENMNNNLRSVEPIIEDLMDRYKKSTDRNKIASYKSLFDNLDRLQQQNDTYNNNINAKMIEVNKNWIKNKKIRDEIDELITNFKTFLNDEGRVKTLESLARFSAINTVSNLQTLPSNKLSVVTQNYGGGRKSKKRITRRKKG